MAGIEYQLRRFHIRADHLDDFVGAWERTIRPLREAAGFTIVGAWVVPSTSELVWVLGYAGEDGFEAADERYYASPDRKALDPDPGQWIESSREWWVRPAGDPPVA